jgi:mRNA-degrading endonuclease RelE of RelBE toxin-antitoxin system
MGKNKGLTKWNIKFFIPEAVNDYKELDVSIKKSITTKIEELKINPFLGEKLGHKFNTVFSGSSLFFRRIYNTSLRTDLQRVLPE